MSSLNFNEKKLLSSWHSNGCSEAFISFRKDRYFPPITNISELYIYYLILFCLFYYINFHDINALDLSGFWLLFSNSFKKVLKIIVIYYFSALLFLRSFFMTDRPYFIFSVILMINVNIWFSILPFCNSYGDQIYILAWLGLYMIGVDNLCSFIAQKAIDDVSSFWAEIEIFLTSKSSDNEVIKYYKAAGLSALIVGKTAMTGTGRAALLGSIIAGGFLLGNTWLQGDFQAIEGQRNRDFQAIENQRNRDFQALENQKNREWEAYKNSWNVFKRPPK